MDIEKEYIIKKYIDDKDVIESCHILDKWLVKNKCASGSCGVFGLIEMESKEDTYKLTVFNIGDSRCFVLRTDGNWKCMTVDHKPANKEEKKRIEDAGGSVRLGRVNGMLAISRAFGDSAEKGIKGLPYEKQPVIATPDVTSTNLEEGDLVLFVCDGLLERLTEEEIVACIYQKIDTQNKEIANNERKELDLASISAELIDLSYFAGSKDNMSVILTQIKKDNVNSVNKVKIKKHEFQCGSIYDMTTSKAFKNSIKNDLKRAGVEISTEMVIEGLKQDFAQTVLEREAAAKENRNLEWFDNRMHFIGNWLNDAEGFIKKFFNDEEETEEDELNVV